MSLPLRVALVLSYQNRPLVCDETAGDLPVCSVTRSLPRTQKKPDVIPLPVGAATQHSDKQRHLGEGVKWLVMLFHLLLIFCFSARCEDCQNPEVPPLRQVPGLLLQHLHRASNFSAIEPSKCLAVVYSPW